LFRFQRKIKQNKTDSPKLNHIKQAWWSKSTLFSPIKKKNWLFCLFCLYLYFFYYVLLHCFSYTFLISFSSFSCLASFLSHPSFLLPINTCSFKIFKFLGNPINTLVYFFLTLLWLFNVLNY
jgi:hypothetical protein